MIDTQKYPLSSMLSRNRPQLALWLKELDFLESKRPQFECSIQFSHSVVSNSLRPHEPQHARPPCPSPNSCPLNQWYYLTISFSIVPFSCLQSFPVSGSFFNELFLRIRWSKDQSFSISPSNEYSGLISFRTDWLDLLVVWGTLKSLLQHHNSKA